MYVNVRSSDGLYLCCIADETCCIADKVEFQGSNSVVFIYFGSVSIEVSW